LLCKWDPFLVEELLGLPCRVLVVADDYDQEHKVMDPALVARLAGFYAVRSVDSVEELSGVAGDVLLQHAPVGLVLSWNEFGQYGAGLLAALLGTPYTTLHEIWRTRDKRVMKAAVGRQGVPVAASRSVPDPLTARAAAEVTAALCFPVVLKPANGFGAHATCRINVPADFATAVARVRRQLPEGSYSRHLVIEEFVEGDEYHVDALWHDGRPVFLQVCRYHVPVLSVRDGGQINGSYTVPEEQEPALYERVRDLHTRVNEALGISRGATHLEFFGQPDGSLVFSEVATRLGGAGIVDMYRHRFGVDLRREWLRSLLAPTPTPVVLRHHAFSVMGNVNLAPPTAGRLASLPTEDRLRQVAGVVDWEFAKQAGDPVDPDDPSDWCLLLVIGGDDQAAYERHVRGALDALPLAVTP
jgi:hypothetical protein